MSRPLLALIAVLVVGFFVLTSTLFTVHQTEQVLITQFGQPIRVIKQPGLHAKLPFIQSIISFDNRLLDYDGPPEELILGDQRRLIVDTFTRFRIINPLEYYQTVGFGEGGIRARLNSIVPSALRRVLGNEPLLSVLSADRGRIMGEIRGQVNSEGRPFGIEVVDVRIRRADLPEENTQAILNRMQSERERVAREARAEGAEVAQRVRAGADRERTVLLAEAQAQADITRGEGEKESIRIFAEAYQKDPSFFSFWRSMQAYREAFGEGGESRLVLTPDSEFLRYLRDGPREAEITGAAAPPATPAPVPAPLPAQ